MENNKNHILIVDDDDRIRNLLKDYLSENSYIVSTAENADQAKERLEYIKFDIIILDVMMPGQNGYELTKEIKKQIKVPIILLTAKGEVENRIKGLELGADDYIGKPFEPKELLLRIKNIINKNTKIDLKSKHKVGLAEIDLNKMTVNLNSKSKKINNSEKKVLVEMLANPGKTYSREEIGKISGISQERSVDVMMPGQDGYELTKEVKKQIKVPIILLTAKGEVESRIKGLELGADDYIGKPFEPKELLLRIKNIISKSSKIDFKSKHNVGIAEIDLNKMTISLKNKLRKISNSEKKVLVEMIANPGTTYSREEIGKISGISQERSIDVMITRLRQKIEENPKNPKFLQTIRGSGYVLWIE